MKPIVYTGNVVVGIMSDGSDVIENNAFVDWPTDLSVRAKKEKSHGTYLIFLQRKNENVRYYETNDFEEAKEVCQFIAGILDVAKNAPEEFWYGNGSEEEDFSEYSDEELDYLDLDSVIKELMGLFQDEEQEVSTND